MIDRESFYVLKLCTLFNNRCVLIYFHWLLVLSLLHIFNKAICMCHSYRKYLKQI